jgi:hypothetical protein
VARAIIFLNFLLALALGAGAIWLGHRLTGSWWSLVLTILIAWGILGAWMRWKVRHWDEPRARKREQFAQMYVQAHNDLIEDILRRHPERSDDE